MPLPIALAPLVPFLLRYGTRAVLLGSAGWVVGRMVTAKGDPEKALKAMQADVVQAYMFFTQSQTKRLKGAGDTLQKNGGNLATFATALLALIEFVSGIKLSKTKEVVRQSKAVLEAYRKLSPAEKTLAKEATKVDVPSEVRNALAAHLYTLGLRTLNDTKVGDMNLSQYLNLKYTGLYYIGRAGKQLTTEEVDALSSTMIHLHSMITGKGKKKEQGPMIEWYRTVGVGVPGADILARLATCPEVQTIGKDAERYIAYALHQPVPDLTFDGIVEEMAERFK